MFSKPKPTDTPTPPKAATSSDSSDTYKSSVTPSSAQSTAPKAKPPASTLSADLTIKGNIRTTGDINVLGNIDGDIRAHLLTIGEGATVKGEVVADDIVVNGRVVGRVRGLKVRLTSTAQVEGDIIHKTIAIESGAHFEGSVQRQEDPLSSNGKTTATAKATVSS